ncbi:glycosyltransferase family 2 protein [Vibrio jasicida]|uniref:glycosyltransferase family 2 protein n=1 Tax=Vibrio jasicida TaxID=766224 RepID=UPI000399963F|nr:glycosyltransferase family 2 protein [Vibrio jasicida]
MKISIIIPVYNGERFIEECIRSAMNQDLDLFEVICINDGSNDNTQNILAQLENEYASLRVINKVNEGPAKAREIGAEKATGEYLVFLDGDDLLAPNALGEIYTVASKNDLDMAVYDYVIFSDQPRFSKDSAHTLKPVSVYTGKEYINQFMYTAYNWDKLWRRDFYISKVISGVGGFYYEDQLPTLKGIYSSNRIARLNIVCVGYRDNASSTTRRAITKEHFQDLRSVILSYSKVLKDNDLCRSRCALMKLAHMLALLDEHRHQLRLEFDKEILSVYSEVRAFIVSQNGGFVNLCQKVGVVYGFYYKLETMCLARVFGFIGKLSRIKRILKEKKLVVSKNQGLDNGS